MTTLTPQTKLLGLLLIGWLFIYTLSLVRSRKISAQIAVSWVLTEIIIFIILLFDKLLINLMTFIGETNLTSIIYIVVFAWLISLMLDTLVRVSSLSTKLFTINQELGLLQERFNRLEHGSKKRLTKSQ
jgi:hypothetical protein